MNVFDMYDETEVVVFLLRKMGIKPHLCGWDYLIDAICIGIHDKQALRNVTKTLYPAVASKNGTSVARCERGIRHAIEDACNYSYAEKWIHVLFDDMCSDTKPSNSLFIATCVSLMTQEKHHPIFETGGSDVCA